MVFLVLSFEEEVLPFAGVGPLPLGAGAGAGPLALVSGLLGANLSTQLVQSCDCCCEAGHFGAQTVLPRLGPQLAKQGTCLGLHLLGGWGLQVLTHRVQSGCTI